MSIDFFDHKALQVALDVKNLKSACESDLFLTLSW